MEEVDEVFVEAQALYDRGDFQRALDCWQGALSYLQSVPGTERLQADCHMGIGVALTDLGRYEESIAEGKQALDIYTKLPGSERDQARCHVNIGVALWRLGRYEEAIHEQEQALGICSKLPGTEREQAACHANIGVALWSLGRHEEGIREQRQALDICWKLPGTERDRATCYRNIGVALDGLGRYDEAIREQEQALAMYSRLTGTERDQAGCHVNIGAALDALGRYEEGITEQRQALGIYSKLPGSERDQATCHRNMGVAFEGLGRYEECIAEQRQALDMYSKLSGTERDQAACHKNIGVALDDLGGYEEAIAEQTQALGIFSKLPDTERSQAGCHVNIGVALRNLGRYEEAIHEQRRALDIFSKLPGTEREQAACHANIGVALWSLGRHEEGIAEQRQALDVCTKLPGSERDQASCHKSIGVALYRLGRYEEGIRGQEQALDIYSKLPGAERDRADCHKNIGGALIRLGRCEEGIREQEQALEIFSKLPGAERDQAACHNNIGVALRNLGRYDEALLEATRALDGFALLRGTESDQASCRGTAGQALACMGRFKEALDLLRTARTAGTGWWLDDVYAIAHEGLGGNDNLREALKTRLASLTGVESERELIEASEYQMSWFEGRAVVYENLASLLLRMGRQAMPVTEPEAVKWGNMPEEIALHYADRGKGRTLLELVSTKALQTGDEASSKLLSESRQLDNEMSVILKQRGQEALPGKEKEFEELTRKIEEKQARQREIEAELRRTAAGAFIEPELLKPAEFVKTLKTGEGCLEYVACEKELIVFLVTRKGVKAFRSEMLRDTPRELRESGKPSIEKLVAAYRTDPDKPESLGLEGLVWLQRDWMDNWDKRSLTEGEHIAISKALCDILLPSDLRKALAEESITHLVVVPSRHLALTSFATLVVSAKEGIAAPKAFKDAKFLVEDYSVSYVQSLSILSAIRNRSGPRRRDTEAMRGFAAFADPIHDDSDPRAKGKAPEVQLAAAERERADTDTIVRGLVRNVGIAPDATLGLTWHRLEEAGREAKSAAGLFGKVSVLEGAITSLAGDAPASVCTGYAANRPVVQSGDLSNYGNILFGVHGHTDMTNPWLSSLMLTDLAAEAGKRQPAPLTMADVFALRLDAENVVLAACQTAMGRMRAGEGVVGFQLAFLFAGADSVMLTQWEAPSVVDLEGGRGKAYPTSEVVVGYFKGTQSGKQHAQALREAQMGVLRQDGELCDPFYWGAWQLFGEWR